MDIQQLKKDIYDHSNPEKQYHAAYQMRFAKDDPEVVPILFSACYEARDPRLQQEAVRSLGVLTPDKAFQAFIKMTNNEDPEKRRRAYYHLGTLGNPKGFDNILRGLRDPEEIVRKAAAISAGRLGDNPNAINALKKKGWGFELHAIKTEIDRSISFIQRRIKGFHGYTSLPPSSDKGDARSDNGRKCFDKTSIPKSYTPKGF